ncbi:MAG TPA: M28 family peptidase [Steroidobacteraceae bacterium]|jgi:Zn-dependent M28 family amino/carboxypeptidase|nr:M28 family peptidase [Steroidobacteraceae bacterium]
MRIERFGVVLALLCALPGCSSRPPKEPPSTDIDDAAYADHVRMLASDEFLGRKPGTPGEDKTVAYLVERFRKLGLKPGNGASFVQQVPLVEIAAAADATLTATGRSGAQRLAYGKDMVIWTKRAVPQVQLQRSELIFVGFGIVAPEYAWNDYANTDVHGKTVVVLAGDPGYASKDPTVFKGNSVSRYGRWAYKIEEAGRQGADGVLLVHDAQTLGFGWDAARATWSGAQFELAGADRYAGRAAVEGWIQQTVARTWFKAAGLDFDAQAAAAAHPGFKAAPLGGISIDATIHNSIRQFNSANVIAVLPGRRGHENLLFTAHWDSLGADDARAGHGIYNGAVDNATGVAGLLVLAQSFARTLPAADRSIVFLATTAAQPDLLGSEYYVENPVFPLRQTAAVINVETLIDSGPTRDVSIIGFGNTDLEDTARADALLQGRETRPEPYPQQGRYDASDSYSFAHHGLPVLFLQAGIDSAARGPAWGRAQIDDYFAHRYRQPSDQYSADFNVRGAVVDLTLDYQIGNRLARSHHFPRWYPNSEFRASHQRDVKLPTN